MRSLAVISMLYAGLFLTYRWADANWPSAVGLQRVLASFSADVLVYRIWRRASVPINVAAALSLDGLLVVTSASDYVLSRTASAARAPVLACIVVYGLASASGPLGRLLKRFEYAGRISYAFYLVHLTVLSLAHAALVTVGGMADTRAVATALLLSLFVSTILADALYRHVERPAREAMVSGRFWLRLTTSSLGTFTAPKPSN